MTTPDLEKPLPSDLRITKDENGTYRKYRMVEYLGIPSPSEIELWERYVRIRAERDEAINVIFEIASNPRVMAILGRYAPQTSNFVLSYIEKSQP